MPVRPHDLLERLATADSFAQWPGNFADRTEARNDAFSEILSGRTPYKGFLIECRVVRTAFAFVSAFGGILFAGGGLS